MGDRGEMGTPTEDRRHDLLAEARRLRATFDAVHRHWREVASLYASGGMPSREYLVRLDAIVDYESLLIDRYLAIVREYQA